MFFCRQAVGLAVHEPLADRAEWAATDDWSYVCMAML